METIKNALADYHNQTRQLIDPLQEQIKNLDGRFESAMTEIGQKMETSGGFKQPQAEVAEPGRFYANVAGQRLPVLHNSERLSGFFPSDKRDSFDLADFVRHNMGIVKNAVVTSSSATVPTYVGTEIIDATRAASRVVEAGAGTVYIDGPTNLAKITGDATVYEHEEGTEDIADSAVTLSPVLLNPATLVAAVPLSAEIVADSPNLNDVLQSALGSAFAQKLDSLALAAILADASIPTAAALDVATWAGILSGVSSALAADQELPQSLICNTADFIARASETASTGGTWLGAPPVLSGMKDLFTTKLSAGEFVMGDFFRSLIIAARSDLRLEVVRWNQYKSGSHVLVAHARVGAVVAQPGRLLIAA